MGSEGTVLIILCDSRLVSPFQTISYYRTATDQHDSWIIGNSRPSQQATSPSFILEKVPWRHWSRDWNYCESLEEGYSGVGRYGTKELEERYGLFRKCFCYWIGWGPPSLSRVFLLHSLTANSSILLGLNFQKSKMWNLLPANIHIGMYNVHTSAKTEKALTLNQDLLSQDKNMDCDGAKAIYIGDEEGDNMYFVKCLYREDKQ